MEHPPSTLQHSTPTITDRLPGLWGNQAALQSHCTECFAGCKTIAEEGQLVQDKHAADVFVY